MIDQFKTIKKESSGIYKEKGSKFIARSFPVKDESEIKVCLERLRKEFYDARHHCYAYILGANKEKYRANDDGEPSGSAGLPIYNQLQSLELTNVLVVIVRYFGGTKLGIPGLINAYKTATSDAISNNKIVIETIEKEFSISCAFSNLNSVMQFIDKHQLRQVESDYSDHVEFRLAVRAGKYSEVLIQLEDLYIAKIIAG